MSIVQQKTAEEVSADILDALAASKGITTREIGDNARSEADAVGAEVDAVYYQLLKLELGTYLNTATRDALDSKGADYSVTRKAAVASIGSVDVTHSGSTTIPAGSLFAAPATTARDEIQYQTLNAETVTGSGTVSIPVRCTQTGVIGNIAASQITKIVNPIASVTAVTNPSATTLGASVESDDAYRARIKRSIAGQTRGTTDSIIAGAYDFEQQSLTLATSMDSSQTYMEVSEDLNTVPIHPTLGVLSINDGAELVSYTGINTVVDPHRITGLTRGYGSTTAAAQSAGVPLVEYIPTGKGNTVENVKTTESPGFVNVYIDDGATTTVATELLQLVSRLLIGDGTDRYPGYKAAGITLTCFVMTRLSVDVAASIVASPGYVLADVITDAQTRVTNFLNTYKDIYLYASDVFSVIETTEGIAGVQAFSMTDGISTVTATGGLGLTATQVARAGTITIS